MSYPRKITECVAGFSASDTKIIKDLYQYYKTLYMSLHNSSNIDHNPFIALVMEHKENIAGLSKPLINKLMFKNIKIEEEIKKEIKEINNLKIDDLIFQDIITSNSKIKEYQDDIDRSHREIRNYTRYINDHIARLKSNKQTIAKLKTEINQETLLKKIKEEFIKIYNSDLFQNVYFDKEYQTIYAIQKNDCILKYQNNGTTCELNFGTFIFQYSFEFNSFTIFPYKDNIANKNRDDAHLAHPYMIYPNELCFGTGTATYADCNENYELFKLFSLADHIMHEYYDDNPATSIYDFKDANKKINHKEYYANLEAEGYENYHKIINLELFDSREDEKNHYGWMLPVEIPKEKVA